MPYPKNSDLPTPVRRSLPEAAQTRFRSVVNSALDRGLSEEKAFASAWSVVRNGWKQSEGGGRWVRKRGENSSPLTLFAHRKLENAEEFIEWAKGQGFSTTMEPNDIHVTLAYSKEPLVWPASIDDVIRVSGGPRSVKALGDGGAIVLRFESPRLEARWSELRDAGASWDYPGYQPHVTITWKGGDLDLSAVEPFDGDLIFGPEVFRELDEDWKDKVTEKSDLRKQLDDLAADVAKLAEEIEKYNPSQPRDQIGRWTDTGGGSQESKGGGGGSDWTTPNWSALPPGPPKLLGHLRDWSKGKDIVRLSPDNNQWALGGNRKKITIIRPDDLKAILASGHATLSDDGRTLTVPRLKKSDEDMTEKSFTKAEVFKVDRGLGLIFGWAVVCKTDGEEYFDTQGDHIPEDAMLKAAAEFMVESRKSKDMHNGEFVGDVIFAFPLTTDIAKAMGISTVHTGLMIAAKPHDPAMLEKYASGEYTGFSIGGQYLENKAEDD